MSSTQLAPAFRQQFFGTNGTPLAGGQIFSYIAGTTTPQATYTDETGATPNTNPIILDSTGTASIWIGSNSYKFVVEDSLSNVIQTIDNVQSPLSRDVNGNFSSNNFIEGYTTTPTAAGTTSLLVGSSYQQYFTGSTTQTVLLPVVSTLVLGQQFSIVNLSSGVVTVQSSGANTLQALASNSQLVATCIAITGTGTASWSWVYTPAIQSSVLPLINGGTGTASASANAAFNALSPMTTGGDIIYGGASGVATRLANGTAGQALISNGTTLAPSWQAVAASLSYAQAYFSSSSSWSTSSTSYVDPTNSGGNALTVRTSNGITLTAAASNKCGVTFTPASASAVYFIIAQLPLYNSGPGDGVSAQLTDGSIVITNPAGYSQGAPSADVVATSTLAGVYAPGTASAVTVKVQLAVVAATGSINAANVGAQGNTVEWTVLRIA